MNGEFLANEKCGASGTEIMKADGDMDEKGSVNTIIFVNSETGIGECYEPQFLYESIKGARRLWMFQDGSKNKDYKFPVFKLAFTGILVDYVAMGAALSCGTNTIFLYKKELRDIYSTGLSVGSKHGTEPVYFGCPIRRSTFFSMRVNDMKDDAKKFQQGKLLLTEEDLTAQYNWEPIKNNNEVFQDDIEQAMATAENTVFENYKQSHSNYIRNQLLDGKTEEEIEATLKFYFQIDAARRQDIEELAQQMIDEVGQDAMKDRGYLFL